MTKRKELYIDLNSDLGEHPGSNLDEQIMPFLSSCNIACGGHAGDIESVRKSILLAQEHDVAIGAHPSYPDQENFGRTVIDISDEKLEKSITNQINLVKELCKELGAHLHHIKPHGALYNQAAKDPSLSNLICQIVKKVDPSIKLYGLAHSVSEEMARKNDLVFIQEGFADRKYEQDRSLMSRSKDGAVITAEKEVIQQVQEMAVNKRVYSNEWIPIKAQTICLHSDTQGAVNLAEKIRSHLEKNGIQITSV